MQTIYRPGQWYLIVIPGALVALPPDVPGEVVAQLWERLPTQKTLATVVDVLTSHAGGVFSSLPPFVAAVAEGTDIRIALRGGVAARVSTDSESHEFSGAEVTTWSERFVGSASRVEITVEAVAGAASLPVQTGVVRAAAVSAELEPGDDRPVTGSFGPTPVVDVEEAGASATALTGTPAPMLAHFGGSDPSEVPEQAAIVAPLVTDDSAQPDADAVDVDVDVDVDVEDATDENQPAQTPEPDVTPAAKPLGEALPEESPDPVDVPSADAEAAPEPEAEEQVAGLAPLAVADDEMMAANEATLAPSTEDFDQLWGATIHSTPAGAPVPVVIPTPAAALVSGVPSDALADQGDHDGATISAAELRALRQQPPVADDVPTDVIPVAQGSTGRVRVSTGQVVALDRTVIIGRRPRSTRASGANLPHLIAVESPQQDISRSHLEIRPEGDTVLVIDLHTTNGSTLLRPGADPIRLHPGEQTLVLSGDVVDLGDGVKVAFEDLP